MKLQSVMVAAGTGYQDVVQAAIQREPVSAFAIDDGESVVRYFLNQRFSSFGWVPPVWKELLQPCAKLPTSCDLVLLNMHLPKLDGIAVLRQLKCLYGKEFSSLPPVIMLSDREDDESLIPLAFQLGCSGFITKSKWTLDSSEVICQAVRHWLQVIAQSGAIPPRGLQRRPTTVDLKTSTGSFELIPV